MFPVLVYRSLEVVNGYESLTFIARFADGSEKALNMKSKAKGISPKRDFGYSLMSNDDCPLYYRDWASCPTLGNLKKHYPKR